MTVIDPAGMPVDCAATPGGAAPIIYVCVTCRGPDPTPAGTIPGMLVAAATARAAAGSGVEVHRVRCLANCSRGPSAAVCCNGSWTYVFGSLDGACGSALVAAAHLLAEAADGIMPWRGRPEPLKGRLIARVPPIGFSEDAE